MKNLAKAAAAAIAKTIGGREITLLAGLGLLGFGAGAIWLPLGLMLPGVVLLYVAIFGLR
jgi:hypothetical protein